MINIDLPAYYESISNFQKQAESFNAFSKKQEEIIYALNEATVFSFGEEVIIAHFPPKIKRIIEKIANLGIGRILFEQLIENHIGPPIQLEFSDKFAYWPRIGKITLKKNKFCAWEDESGKFILGIPSKLSFIHEVFHYLHFLENKHEMVERSTQINVDELLHPNFDNIEEQITICGIDSRKIDILKTILFCENHFRHAWSLPYRFTHQSYLSPESIIEKNLMIDSESFGVYFKKYWKKLPAESIEKMELVIFIEKPTENQIKLIEAINSVVKVFNLAIDHPKDSITYKNIY